MRTPLKTSEVQLLVKQLIEVYEFVIEEYKEFQSFSTIIENHTEYGVCHCAEENFHEVIYWCSWIVDHKKPGKLYWYPVPSEYCYFKENLDRLEYRLNILKLIYEENNA